MISNWTFFFLGLGTFIGISAFIYFKFFGGDFNYFIKKHGILSIILLLGSLLCLVFFVFIHGQTLNFKIHEQEKYSDLMAEYRVTESYYTNSETTNIRYKSRAEKYNEEAKKWIEASKNPIYSIYFKNTKCNWDELPLIEIQK